MYPQYICTRVYPHKSPVYVHQTNSVDTHPHARIDIYTIHTYKFMHKKDIDVHKCVHRMQSVLILPACCHTSTHVAKHCADNPTFACLRSLCGFIIEKHGISRKSALYKALCIRKRSMYLRQRSPYFRTRALYVCQETQRSYPYIISYTLLGTSRRLNQCARCSTYIHTYF